MKLSLAVRWQDISPSALEGLQFLTYLCMEACAFVAALVLIFGVHHV